MLVLSCRGSYLNTSIYYAAENDHQAMLIEFLLNGLFSRQSGVLPALQTNLVVSFFKNVQDTTLLKIPFAQTSANPDFLDFSVSKVNVNGQ